MKPERLSSDDAVEAAIARVLDAERAARDAVRAAELAAASIDAHARAQARSVVERAERRIGVVRSAFETTVAANVGRLDAAAAAAATPHTLTAAELALLERAVARLVAELAGKP